MKKTKRSALLAAVITLALLVGVMALMLVASAEGAEEATLRIESVTYNSSGVVSSTEEVSTESGSYQEMLERLTEISPESATRYVITLSGDATQTAPVSISANEYAEVCVELAGNQLTYTGSGAAVTLSGASTFRVNGGFDKLGEFGVIAVTAADGALLALSESSEDLADVRNVDVTYASGSLFEVAGGELTLRESAVSYVGETQSSIVSATGAVVSLKYVDVNGTDSLSVLDLSGADASIEGGYIFAGTAVRTDTTECDVIFASVDMEVVNAFKPGSTSTNIYVVGGNISVSAALVAGEATAETLVFYYGDGTMTVGGADPTSYGLGHSLYSFSLVGETYEMVLGSTTAVATSTVAVLGQVPTVAYHTSYIKGMGSAGIGRITLAESTAPTIVINTLLADAPVASNVTLVGNEYVSVIIDLNGYDLNWSATTAKHFNYSGNFHYTFDGADKDGNVGAVSSNSKDMMFFYPRQTTSTGYVNEHTVTRVQNASFLVNNLGSTGSNSFININSGSAFISNVSVTYTGTALDDTATNTYVNIMGFDHSAGPEVYAVLDKVRVTNAYTGDIAVRAFVPTAEAVVFVKNSTVENCSTVFSSASGTVSTLIDSTATTTDTIFTAGEGHVYDCQLTVASGAVSTTGTVYFHEAERCETTVNTGENILGGKYETEEGFAMVPTSDGKYELTSGVEAPEPITLPAVFANGMVFQRGKTINVFGYCDDTDAELKITLGDLEGTASVDENGEWYVELPAMEVAWDLTLTIQQTNSIAENMVRFTNVAVGEVWVISGQSNAQLQVGYLEDVEELAVLADSLKNIRSYRSTAGYTLYPSKYGSAVWDADVTAKDVRSTSTSMGLSAVGYAAVAKIAAELGPDVPVAIMHVARGASKIKTWLDYESLAAISPSEAAKYDECVAAGALPADAHKLIGTCLYNHQIAPLEGFEVAGVMWYQGCGDVAGVSLGTEGKSYTEYFTALENVYRRVFGNDSELPFYVMELAPYTRDNNSEVTALADFKAEQFDFCRSLPDTYLVSNMTDGSTWSETIFSQGYIHPARKSTIGNRTADMILANEYGYDFGSAYTHPMPVSVEVVGSSVVITFDTELKLLFGDKAVGFELYGGSAWYDATAVVDGKTVTLTSASVSSPTMVRYGYSPCVAELRDGSMIEFLSGKVSVNDEAKTITITDTAGNAHVISDASGYIRTIDYGNVTNASGIPMPVFKMTCN